MTTEEKQYIIPIRSEYKARCSERERKKISIHDINLIYRYTNVYP